MIDKLKVLFSTDARDAQLREHLERLRQRTPVPVIWLFGRTQSGKTSIIKYLTGADEAEIGQGFRPCTRFSRRYDFPTSEAPLVTFLDTRGLDEPGYDPDEDLKAFNHAAHVLLVTARVLDHAQQHVRHHLRTIRQARPDRPVILALTCLHEAYPQQQHPQPYPFTSETPTLPPELETMLEPLLRSAAEQRRSFAGLYDRDVLIDLTVPDEGYNEPNYGGEQLKQGLLDVLPAAYRQTLISLDEAMRDLQDVYARHALPHIIGYSSLAASAGAIPIPFVDLVLVPAIQTRMIYHLAQYYGQPLSGTRFLELASTLGLGLVVRQATREIFKFIPWVGSVAAGMVAGSSTFALGKAFCYYYRAVHKGHVPRPEDVRHYYQQQLKLAEEVWFKRAGAPVNGAPAPGGG